MVIDLSRGLDDDDESQRARRPVLVPFSFSGSDSSQRLASPVVRRSSASAVTWESFMLEVEQQPFRLLNQTAINLGVTDVIDPSCRGRSVDLDMMDVKLLPARFKEFNGNAPCLNISSTPMKNVSSS